MHRTLTWLVDQASDEEVDQNLYIGEPRTPTIISAGVNVRSHSSEPQQVPKASEKHTSPAPTSYLTPQSQQRTPSRGSSSSSPASNPPPDSNHHRKRTSADILIEDKMFQAAVCTEVSNFQTGTNPASLSMAPDTTASLTLWMPYELPAR